MNSNFKLVPKFEGNIMVIYFVLPNGENRQILQCMFPDDRQLRENIAAADEIISILRRRIKRSLD